jgi:hypothetical protein
MRNQVSRPYRTTYKNVVYTLLMLRSSAPWSVTPTCENTAWLPRAINYNSQLKHANNYHCRCYSFSIMMSTYLLIPGAVEPSHRNFTYNGGWTIEKKAKVFNRRYNDTCFIIRNHGSIHVSHLSLHSLLRKQHTHIQWNIVNFRRDGTSSWKSIDV